MGDFRPGEASGEREGKDSSVLAEVGVTRECFRDPALRVPDLREAVESWDEVRFRFLLLSFLLSSLLLLSLLRPAISDVNDAMIEAYFSVKIQAKRELDVY